MMTVTEIPFYSLTNLFDLFPIHGSGFFIFARQGSQNLDMIQQFAKLLIIK